MPTLNKVQAKISNTFSTQFYWANLTIMASLGTLYAFIFGWSATTLFVALGCAVTAGVVNSIWSTRQDQ